MKNIELYKDRIGEWDKDRQGYFKVDPWCDQVFYANRSNQKFINARNKSAYHNQKNRSTRRALSKQHAKFNNNYRVLDKFLPKSMGRFEISYKDLLEEGYDETAPVRTGKRSVTNRPFYVYSDRGLEMTGNGMCIIHKMKT